MWHNLVSIGSSWQERAIRAIAVYVFLRSGLLTVASNSNAGVLATSFVAGFSERFVVNAAGLVSKSRPSTT